MSAGVRMHGHTNAFLNSLKASRMIDCDEITAPHIEYYIDNEILIMKGHKVPPEPNVEKGVQVPTNIASMFVQKEHIIDPKQLGEIFEPCLVHLLICLTVRYVAYC